MREEAVEGQDTRFPYTATSVIKGLIEMTEPRKTEEFLPITVSPLAADLLPATSGKQSNVATIKLIKEF